MANGSTGAGSANGMIVGVDGSGNGIVSVRGVFDYITSVAGVERMRITSTGNVGIGTTSPKSYASLTTNGSIVAIGGVGVGVGESFRLNNYYNAGTGTDRTIATGYAASVGLDNSGGGMTFNLSSSSITADNNVTVTERMRITSAGEACIGRTTAYGAGFLLNVQGNIYTSAGIVTGAPSGESSATWKLGDTRTGTCVPGSWGDFSSWFTGTVANIEINGTTYTIPVVNAGYC
jgi:hypothetical protein